MSIPKAIAPDWLVCLECESPCYIFEWRDGEVLEAVCTTCANEDPEMFMSPGDFEDLEAGD